MDIPSSPPLLPEPDAPVSPSLAPDAAAELPIRPDDEAIVAGGSRKRPFSDYGGLSSDPLFSEGTSEPEEEDENGSGRRRRKMVKGPYINLRRSSTQSFRRAMAKRERLRFADSGVWLGSDMSDDSVDSLRSSQQQFSRMVVDERPPATHTTTANPPPSISSAEAHAVQTINSCLDNGRETVDITDLGLHDLSSTTLRPLHQLIRHSHTDLTHPPSEDEFSPLTPSIQLFISGNKLSSLPSELFRLTNITVLSLRNNDLKRIPPHIGQLSNLKELNIAQNNIKWLPWELLDLVHCRGAHRQIIVRPNPLVNPIDELHGPSPLPRPNVTPGEFNEHLNRWGETSGAFFSKMKQWYSEEDFPWSMRHELELRLKLGRLKRTNYLQEASRAGMELKLCREQLVFLASSAVRFFGVDGTPYRTSASTVLYADDHTLFRAVVDPLAEAPESCSTTASLFEHSLRSIQANYSLQDLYDLPEELPSTVIGALQSASTGTENGNESCSICGKHFVIARAEWMEFWFNGFPSQECLTQETVLPFLRRVCSWRCARPNEMGAFLF